MNALLLALAVAAAMPRSRRRPGAGTRRPLTLEQALELARANPQLAQAQASVMQAQGQVGIARSGFLPGGIGAAPRPAGRPATSAPARPPCSTTPTTRSITLNQTLWDFGRTLGAYLAARDQERAARAGVDAAWNAVELNVRTAYYTVLATEALVAVADQTVASNQRQLDLARGQFEVGQRPRFDVTTADVNLQQSLISQITAHDGGASSPASRCRRRSARTCRSAPCSLPTVPQDIDLDVPRLMAEALGGPPRSQGRRAPDLGRRPEPVGREVGLVSHPRGRARATSGTTRAIPSPEGSPPPTRTPGTSSGPSPGPS